MTTSKVAQTGLYAETPQMSGKISGGQTDDFSKIFASQSAASGEKAQTKDNVQVNSEKTEIDRKAEECTTAKAEDSAKDTSKDTAVNADQAEEPQETQATQKPAETQDAQDMKTEDLYTEEVMEAITEMMAAIQELLGVTPEQLQETLEELGLSVKDLLNPDMLPKIVIALTEGADELSVMTNEKLFADIVQLTAKAENILDTLAKEWNLSPESLKEMIQNLPQQENETEEILLNTDQGSEAEVPVVEESRVQVSVVHSGASHSSKDSRQGEDSTTGQQMTMTQNVLDHIEQAVTKTETVYSDLSKTETIMNQIKDVIKVIQSEDVTEMEMQLHPASLGHVRVQLSVKEGVLTAAFTTENEAVKAALESQMLVLKQNFEQQGIKVEAVEVTVASHAFERNLDSNENGAGEEQEPEKKKAGRKISLSQLLSEEAEELSDEDRIVAEMMKQNGNTVDYTV